MKLQTGIDIIEVPRIQEAIEKQGESFLNRIYTPSEKEYCSNTNKMQYQHYAARFAAKEAVFKAISSMLPNNNKKDLWTQIEIQNNKEGKPEVIFHSIDLPPILSMDLSISHLKEYAVANFTILFE